MATARLVDVAAYTCVRSTAAAYDPQAPPALVQEQVKVTSVLALQSTGAAPAASSRRREEQATGSPTVAARADETL